MDPNVVAVLKTVATILGTITPVIGAIVGLVLKRMWDLEKEYKKNLESDRDFLREQVTELSRNVLDLQERAIDRAERYAETTAMYVRLLDKD
jgi:hypothetical protein